MIRGNIKKQISGSPTFVDLKPGCQSNEIDCGALCNIRSWNKSDSSQIGIGFYDDFD